jgi:hypothetical protein
MSVGCYTVWIHCTLTNCTITVLSSAQGPCEGRGGDVYEEARVTAWMGERASGFGAVAANALNRQSQTTEKCWTSCLEIGRVSHHENCVLRLRSDLAYTRRPLVSWCSDRAECLGNVCCLAFQNLLSSLWHLETWILKYIGLKINLLFQKGVKLCLSR